MIMVSKGCFAPTDTICCVASKLEIHIIVSVCPEGALTP